MQKVCQMIATYCQHISTIQPHSTTKSSECVCQSTLSWGRASQSQKAQLREICSEKCLEMSDLSRSLGSLGSLLQASSSQPHHGHGRKRWSPGKWIRKMRQRGAWCPPERLGRHHGDMDISWYLMMSHDISKSLPWPFTCVIICYSMCGNSKKSDIYFIFSFM